MRLGDSAAAKFEAGLAVGWLDAGLAVRLDWPLVGWTLGWPLVVGWMHWPENWAPTGSWHFDLRVR